MFVLRYFQDESELCGQNVEFGVSKLVVYTVTARV